MTTKHTLYEGVLNDDSITVFDDKSALLTYYTYATEWSNHKHNESFSDLQGAMRFYRKRFTNRVIEQGKRWREEDSDGYNYNIDDTPEQYWTTVVYEQGMEI